MGLLTESIQRIRGQRPEITTVSKQDNFVLINYAGIPTVSFGIGLLEGRGGVHQPDESIHVDKLWQGATIAFDTVNRWLEEEI